MKYIFLFFLIMLNCIFSDSYPVYLTSEQERIIFPQKPEHFTKSIASQIECSIYCTNDQEMTYLTVIIPFEKPLSIDQATIALEGFMSGILHNQNNQLKSADLITVQEMPALEFNIESQNKHFQGRTIMCANHLILIAVEYQKEKKQNIRQFIESYSYEKSK